jgi:hypothetical protein
LQEVKLNLLLNVKKEKIELTFYSISAFSTSTDLIFKPENIFKSCETVLLTSPAATCPILLWQFDTGTVSCWLTYVYRGATIYYQVLGHGMPSKENMFSGQPF